MTLAGKVALITGAAQGLGKAFAEELLKNGAKVGLSDINEVEGQSTLSEFSDKYGAETVLFKKADIANHANMTDLFDCVKDKLGGLDIVINNAGIGKEFDGWQLTVDINVKGTIDGTMLAMEHMRKDKRGNGGVIINIASMAGLNPMPVGPVYAATKAAIIHYTVSCAANPVFLANGVRLNVVAPSFADTPMYQRLTDPSQVHAPQFLPILREVGGLMTPEYVAQNVVELIEDSSKNGAVLILSEGRGGKRYHTPANI